jgi:hypothetical protein
MRTAAPKPGSRLEFKLDAERYNRRRDMLAMGQAVHELAAMHPVFVCWNANTVHCGRRQSNGQYRHQNPCSPDDEFCQHA